MVFAGEEVVNFLEILYKKGIVCSICYMIKISSIVEEIVSESSIAQRAMQEGVLNLSTYARKIHSQVEEKTKKEVRVGSIVAALMRYQHAIQENFESPPFISYEDLLIATDLIELRLEKNSATLKTVNDFQGGALISSSDFLMIDIGVHEIVLLCNAGLFKQIQNISSDMVIWKTKGLAAITFKSKPEYVNAPGVFYMLLERLFVLDVNVVQIRARDKEISVVVPKEDVQKINRDF